MAPGAKREVRILGVIPGDRLDDYEAKGIGPWLSRYYNPGGFFDRVYCFSPHEARQGVRHGMFVLPTRPWQLAYRVQRFSVNILRAYGGGWSTDFLLRARSVGVPLVASVHDIAPERLSDGIRCVDLVFCMSRIVRDIVCARGVPENKIRILPNRVDRDLFAPDPSDRRITALRQRFPWRHGILHVGRRSHEKNLGTVIAALARLGPEYGLLAIGPGDAAPYEAEARMLGLDDRCVFLGPVSNAELPAYLRWCACMCGPSRREGFGLVFIEAMACGVPVVTSAIQPMSEYIQDGINGVLVTAFEDPAAVAAAIARACEEPLRTSLSLAARERTSDFAVDTIDTREVALYREALALPRRAGFLGAWGGVLRGLFS